MKKIFAVFLLLALTVTASYAADYVPGDVIVVLRNTSNVSVRAAAKSSGGVKSLSSVQALAQSSKSNVKRTFDSLSEESGNVFMVLHSDKEDARSLLRKVSANPNVIAASLNGIRHAYAESSDRKIPNDPEYYQLWGMEAIKAPYAWTTSTGSNDVYVAVIDSGIDYTHPDLAANFSEASLKFSKSFVSNDNNSSAMAAYMDDQSHGTHVAGTISAIGNNGIGVAGVNWNVKLIALKSLDSTNGGTDETCYAAVNHLVGVLRDNPNLNVAAVNYSVGGSRSFSPYDQEAAANIEFLAFKTLSDMNRVVICLAAGNEAAEVGAPNFFADFEEINQGDYVYPPSFRGLDNAIVVAAAAPDFTRASFSNYSRKYVDIAAPGLNIFSTVPTTLSVDLKYDTVNRTYPYEEMSGTSMAAPHLSGVVALLKSIYPNATPQQIKAAIIGGADSAVLCDDGTSMYGMLDIQGARNYFDITSSADSVPVIAFANSPVAVVDQPYNFRFYAAGPGNITWAVDGVLPAGLSFDKNSGVIHGTPLSVDKTEIIVTAQNDNGQDSMVFVISTDAGVAPLIENADVYDVAVGSSTGSYIRLKEGTWPFVWEILNSSDITTDGTVVSLDKSGYWEIAPKTAKTYTIKVRVSNFAGYDSMDINVPVLSADNAVKIYDKTLKRAVAGRVYGMSVSSDFPATYNVNPYMMKAGDTISTDCLTKYTWIYDNLPKGMTCTEKNGIFTIAGTPTSADTYNFIISVSNDYYYVSKDFPLIVENAEPSFLASKYDLVYAQGVNMTLRIPVLGTPNLTLGFSGDVIPGVDFMNEEYTATLTGFPTTKGEYKAVITASNDYGFASADLIITITDPAVITTSVLPDAVVGNAYSFKFTSLNNVPLSWRVSGDILAGSGLTLSPSGELTGTPTRAGDYRFLVEAKGTELQGTWIFLLHVNAKPSITNATTLPSGKVNTPYGIVYLTYNGTNPVWWSLTSGAMPKGLVLTTDGCIYGTPVESGDFTFALSAQNSSGNDSRTFTITIASDGSGSGGGSGGSGGDSEGGDSGGDTTIIPVITQGSSRGITSLTAGELAVIANEDGIIAAVLPEISVNVSGVYTFESVDSFANVKLSSDVPEGYVLVWHPFTRNTSGSLVEDSDGETATFYDTDGDITDTVPENHTVNISAYLEAGTKYYPAISAVANSTTGGLGSSSGGCTAGISILSLLTCALFFRKNSR